MDNIFIVIPTLNPNIDILDKFLEKLKKEFKNILVYDDGCKKQYEEYFKSLEKKGIIVLHHYINLGKGRAMKDAFNYLLNKYPRIEGIVTADSDGQHSIKDIKKCAKEVLENKESLILGCRNFDQENVPRRSRFGNKITIGVLKGLVGVSVADTQTGLRGLPKNVMVKFLDTPGERYEYETNQLIDTITKDIKIKEIPIETIYINGNVESHFNPFKDSFNIYKVFFKYIASALSSFIIDILLFTILNSMLNMSAKVVISTIIARIFSSIYNYLVNAKMVFKKQNNTSFIKYATLVVIQMLISAISVDCLAKVASINVVLIKLIVDIIIFVANFIIQREFVFRGEVNAK